MDSNLHLCLFNMHVNSRAIIDNPTANLFDRVPERVFMPLGASEYARRNLSLLAHLYNDFFAPESDPPDGEGWPQKRITSSVERV